MSFDLLPDNDIPEMDVDITRSYSMTELPCPAPQVLRSNSWPPITPPQITDDGNDDDGHTLPDLDVSIQIQLFKKKKSTHAAIAKILKFFFNFFQDVVIIRSSSMTEWPCQTPQVQRSDSSPAVFQVWTEFTFYRECKSIAEQLLFLERYLYNKRRLLAVIVQEPWVQNMTEQALIPFVLYLRLWFQDASWELCIELREFVKLYDQQFNNIDLVKEVGDFLFDHPTLAYELQEFIKAQTCFHLLVSQHLSY